MAEGFRLRVCFTKTGRLRLLSHLELTRAYERAVRRSGLPYAVSQGFSPKMRVSFGPALPVGTAGEREYLDVFLTRFVPQAEAAEALRRSSVEELRPRACGYVSPQEPSLTSAITIATYDVHLGRRIPHDEAERALRSLLDSGTLCVDHKGKKRVFDLSYVLPKEPEIVSEADATILRVAVRIGDVGSLRPDALVHAALGPDIQTTVTRTGLFCEDTHGWHAPLTGGHGKSGI